MGRRCRKKGWLTALGVGRTPVREAIIALQRQGLIDVQPQKGSFVFLPSEAGVAELCEFREMMEIQALSLCYSRRKDAALAQMRKANEDMVAAARHNDHLAFDHGDGDFHNALFENCKNNYLTEADELASAQVAALRMRTWDLGRALNEHWVIIEAMASDDVPRAKQVLSRHILKMQEVYASAIQSEVLEGSKRNLNQSLTTLSLSDD